MTRALVTGSTGQVGANLVAVLNEHGIDVVGLQRSTSPQDATSDLNMTAVVGDILNPDSLSPAMKDIDWVFHVAAIADYWRSPTELVYRVNVDGTRNVMQAALNAGVKRFVLTGSTAALGIPTSGKPLIDESNEFNVSEKLFPYGHSKLLAERVLAEFVGRGLDALTVLPAAVAGPRDLKFNVGELIVQALKPGPFPVPPGGLNYIDARDVAEGHISAAEKGRTGARYILAAHNMTHAETYNIVCKALGIDNPQFKVPDWFLPPMALAVDGLHKIGVELPVDRGRVILSKEFMYYDNSKAVEELGLTTRPFAESIADTYSWYIEHDFLQKRGL